MSLVCTPQTGKVLNYNSSVNSQLVHKRFNWHSSRQATKLPKKGKLLKREKIWNKWLRRRGNYSETPWNHDLTPTAMTDRGTGSGKRDHGAMVAPPTASNGWCLGSDTLDTTNGRRHRRNGSGSYGRKRLQRGSVTRGDDVTKTSVRSTHSVAPSSTRRRRTWTAGRQPVHRQLRMTLSSAAAHTRTAARQLARLATPDSHSDSFGLTVRQLPDDYWVTLIHPLSSASGAQF